MQGNAVSGLFEEQGHKPGRGRNDRVSESIRNDEPGAVAAALWKRLSAGRQHHCPGVNISGCGDEREPVACRRDLQHPPTGQKRDAEAPRFPKQRFEHVARAVAVGEELAAGFFVNVHAELAEERDRLAHRKRAQYTADDGRSSSPEIVLGDDGVGNVAARSAADENLGARLARAFDQGDRSRRILSSREDRSGEAGGAGTDDDDVVCRVSVRQRRKLILSSPPTVCRRHCNE